MELGKNRRCSSKCALCSELQNILFFEKELFLKSIKMSCEKLKICNQSIGSRCEKIKDPTDRDPPSFPESLTAHLCSSLLL
jgi:hypothetical protein